MDPLKFIREVAGASHYRSSPRATLQYAYAKWVYFRHRESSPEKFLEDLGFDATRALRGFETWRAELELVIASVQTGDGCQGGISLTDGKILYGLARALRPEYVVETGVAAGVSTSFLGAALVENGHGEIFSIELPPNETQALALADGSRYTWQERGVGWSIPESIKRVLGERHHLILRDVRLALPEILREIPHVDLFFHDDLHTPDHMLWEYETVWPKLSPGAVLVSDDVNYGWIEFCKRARRDSSAFRNVDRLCALRKSDLPCGQAAFDPGSIATKRRIAEVVPSPSRATREEIQP